MNQIPNKDVKVRADYNLGSEVKSLRAFSVKSVDEEKRQITAVASSEIVDRDGEIVSLAALKKAVKKYLRNPVILAGHSHRLGDGRSPVIGKVVSHVFKGRDFIITVEFAKTSLADEYWHLYRDKFQRAFSIGFRGLEYEDESRDGRRVRVFKSIELFEISCVTVPANPAALSKAKAFGQRKKIAREKQRIMNDDEAYYELLDRLEEIENECEKVFGEIPSNSDVWNQFTPAEIEILKELDLADLEFTEAIDDDSLWDGTDDLSDDETEDYLKSLTGDSDATDNELDFLGNFGPDGSEPDYF